MSGRNFSLTDHLSDFVDRQVKAGRHQNASEVVREALRRYQDDIQAAQASIALIEEVAARGMSAIARGDFISVKGIEDARKLMQKFNARAAKRAQVRSRGAKAQRG